MTDIIERMQTWIAALMLSGIAAAVYVAVSVVADPAFTL